MSNCPQFGEKRLLLNPGKVQWGHSWGSFWPSDEVSKLARLPSDRVSDCLTARFQPARPNLETEIGNLEISGRLISASGGRVPAADSVQFSCNQCQLKCFIYCYIEVTHGASMHWGAGRVAALSDCVYFVDEVLLKSLHSMARCPDAEYLVDCPT